LLDDDLALLDQPLQHPADVEAIAAVLETQSEVLEVDEDGQGIVVVGHNRCSRDEWIQTAVGQACDPFLLPHWLGIRSYGKPSAPGRYENARMHSGKDSSRLSCGSRNSISSSKHGVCLEPRPHHSRRPGQRV